MNEPRAPPTSGSAVFAIDLSTPPSGRAIFPTTEPTFLIPFHAPLSSFPRN